MQFKINNLNVFYSIDDINSHEKHEKHESPEKNKSPENPQFRKDMDNMDDNKNKSKSASSILSGAFDKARKHFNNTPQLTQLEKHYSLAITELNNSKKTPLNTSKTPNNFNTFTSGLERA